MFCILQPNVLILLFFGTSFNFTATQTTTVNIKHERTLTHSLQFEQQTFGGCGIWAVSNGVIAEV